MLVRVKFSKHGVLKYIGHLDLMRYFQKAFRRTDIDVCYSKGFSPHMIMSFAQPLGVGVESDGEYFDVEVNDNEDVSLFPSKLNEQMAEGVVVLDAVALPKDTENAMASVAAAAYEIHFDKENPLSDELMILYEKASFVTYTKKTKTGEHEINVKDYVFELRRISDNVLYVVCDCSSSGNLKPINLVNAMLSLLGKSADDYPVHVYRKETYKRNDSGILVPLGEI